MSKPKHGCPYNKPYCLKCPFDDCYATIQDINRQEALKNKEITEKYLHQRNQNIIELYQQGLNVKDISNQLSLTSSIVRRVISIYKRSLQ